MRDRRFVVGVLLVGSLGFNLFAADKPPADYQKAMKDLGAFSEAIAKAVAAENYDDVATLAKAAVSDFQVAGMYWKAKAPDAFKAATAGEKAATDLAVVAGLKSKEGVEYSAKEVTAVCMGCHDAHRQALPDGTFEIK
jgi:cytochrome c556